VEPAAGFHLRRAVPADAEELGRTALLGFETYRSFAPRGWEPPASEAELTRERLALPAVWCAVGEHDREMAGHVGFVAAALHAFPDEDPELAHLWGLFVRPEHWGTGLAASLHSAALAEASARGYRRFRLFVAAAQGRARRFYEREGWGAVGEPILEPYLGLEIFEYRRPLP
jgi:GNAT superfamily N-acetyltransferase